MLKIKAGDRLDAYHDGKCSPSRLVVVVVDDVLNRKNFSRKARSLWHKALKKDFCDVFDSCCTYVREISRGRYSETKQLWDWNCTEFIVGHILNDKDTEKDLMMFARRPDGFGWYGVNWNYSLDIDGSIRKRSIKRWRSCAEEMGQTMKWNATAGVYDYFDKKTGRKVEV